MPVRRYGPYAVETANEDKELFPDDGLTKGDLIDYYERISIHMLPHLRDRPLVMKRFPDGIGGDGFYQRQVPEYFPTWIETVRVGKKDGRQTLVVADNRATLAYLGHQACITHHSWLNRADRPAAPDRVIFDIDPPDEVFGAVRDAAKACRALFDDLGLSCFINTTGSRGVHLLIPLKRGPRFDTVRKFARRLAEILVSRHRKLLTIEQRKRKRKGRVYLDVGRNAYAQTAVAPYAVRALSGAPVATPIDWEELDRVDARSFTVRTIFRRLSRRSDPWRGLRRRARSLKAMAEATSSQAPFSSL